MNNISVGSGTIDNKGADPQPSIAKRTPGMPNLFELLEGHRPLKPGEAIQVGDKRVKPTYDSTDRWTWETVGEGHKSLGHIVGGGHPGGLRSSANGSQSIQRPIANDPPKSLVKGGGDAVTKKDIAEALLAKLEPLVKAWGPKP